jgi:hypothetical protein
MDLLPNELLLAVAHRVADKRLPLMPMGQPLAAFRETTRAFYAAMLPVGFSRKPTARRLALTEQTRHDVRRALRHLLALVQTCRAWQALLAPRWQWIYEELVVLARLVSPGATTRRPPPKVRSNMVMPPPRWYELAALDCAVPVAERQDRWAWLNSDTARPLLVEPDDPQLTHYLSTRMLHINPLDARATAARVYARYTWLVGVLGGVLPVVIVPHPEEANTFFVYWAGNDTRNMPQDEFEAQVRAYCHEREQAAAMVEELTVLAKPESKGAKRKREQDEAAAQQALKFRRF